jgi:hypothetical protein
MEFQFFCTEYVLMHRDEPCCEIVEMRRADQCPLGLLPFFRPSARTRCLRCIMANMVDIGFL